MSQGITTGFTLQPYALIASPGLYTYQGPPESFSTTGAPAAPNPVGINVQNNTSSGGLPLFQDRTREAAGFYVSPSNQTQTTVDANGWPTTDTFIALVDGASTQTWNNGSGTWKCGFICNTPSAAATVSVVGSGGASCTVTNRNSSTGYVSFDMTLNGSGGPYITGTTNGITNIFNYLPGYGSSTIVGGLYQYSSTSLFTTEAINHYSGFGCLRFMWDQNAWEITSVITASNRNSAANTKFQSAPFGHTGDGMPIEWLVDLCKACGVGGWFCIPVRADSTWISFLATYLAANMPVGVPIYIEVGNELWNGTGSAATAFQSDASAAGLSMGAYLGKKLADMQPTFSSAFGARFGTDLRMVAMDQTGTSGFGRIVNATIPYIESNYGTVSNYLWGVGCAPYMSRDNRLVPGDGVNHINNNDTIANIQSQLTANGNYIGLLSLSEHYKVVALAKGLKLVAYESRWESGSETTAVTNLGAAIMDTGMQTVDTNYLDKISACGFDAMMLFQSGIYVGGDVRDPQYSESTSFANIATAPRYLAARSRASGWQITHRNTVSGSGSIVLGVNYLGNVSAISASDPAANIWGPFTFSPIHYAGGEYIVWLIWCTAPATYSVVWNGTGSGTTNVEANGSNIVHTGVALSTGNVTLGSFPLVSGWNYMGLGNGSVQSWTTHSLTFN